MQPVGPLPDLKQETTFMSPEPPRSPPCPAQPEEMLTAKEFAKVLKVSLSWLAKAPKRGDGPPFFRAGRSVRYFPLRKPE
jgi:hypothetical protein